MLSVNRKPENENVLPLNMIVAEAKITAHTTSPVKHTQKQLAVVVCKFIG